MTELPLNEIVGLMVEEDYCKCGPKAECKCDLGMLVGRNMCIQEQGLRKIRANREKMAKEIANFKSKTKGVFIPNKYDYELADAISEKLGDILEFVGTE